MKHRRRVKSWGCGHDNVIQVELGRAEMKAAAYHYSSYQEAAVCIVA